MTSIFDENGINVACTMVEAGPCVVTQLKTEEKDGYESVQIGFENKNLKKSINQRLVILKNRIQVLKKFTRSFHLSLFLNLMTKVIQQLKILKLRYFLQLVSYLMKEIL